MTQDEQVPIVGETYECRNGKLIYARTVLEVHKSINHKAMGVTYKGDWEKTHHVSIEKWNKWQERAENIQRDALIRAAFAIQRAIGGDVEITVRAPKLDGGEVGFVTRNGEVVRK